MPLQIPENELRAILDVFVWAYTRSAKRYKAVRQSLGELEHGLQKYL